MSIALVSQGSIAASGSPAFGTATTAGNLLVAWVGSTGSTASPTITTTASGWAQAGAGGAAFSWAALWYKANCSSSETAPVFTDSAGVVEFAQLAEYSGAATSSPVDQHGGAPTGTGASAWEVVLAPDGTPGDLVCAAGFWNGGASGAVISVTQFTDSARAAMAPHLQQSASGSLYLASMWGVTSGTGSDGDVAWMQMTKFNGGAGAAASFKPASPVSGSLAVATASLPGTWLDFPYVSQALLATGGKPSYAWAVTAGSLPAGMSLSSAGVLSAASCTAAGSASFTVQVTDGSSSTATASLSVTVNSPPAGFTSLTTGSASNTSLGPYSDPAYSPASNGFNSYVSADWVQPTGSYTQSVGAYSPSVFYVTANGAPAGTGQVQAYPASNQQWNNWGSGGWNGFLNTPLSALAALTATFNVTNPVTGSFEFAFDIWTGYTSTNVPGTGSPQDIMIWVYTTPERGIGNAAPMWAPDVTVGTRTYDVYGTPFGGEIIFAVQGAGGTGTYAEMTSGTIDILGPLQWCIANGLNLGNPPTLNLLDLGWEICNTDTYLGSGATQAQSFVCNALSYSVSFSGTPLVPGRQAGSRVTAVPARIGGRAA